MRYYTSTIPISLAEKLKEKGMPMMSCFNITQTNSFSDDDGIHFYYLPTFGACFDWFLNKEIFVNAYPERIAAAYGEYIYMYRPFVNGWIGKESDRTSWHEAANAAIEKAITLI